MRELADESVLAEQYVAKKENVIVLCMAAGGCKLFDIRVKYTLDADTFKRILLKTR